jgi:peptidoglycan/LPS O-acetylase OafA/YrhL
MNDPGRRRRPSIWSLLAGVYVLLMGAYFIANWFEGAPGYLGHAMWLVLGVAWVLLAGAWIVAWIRRRRRSLEPDGLS